VKQKNCCNKKRRANLPDDLEGGDSDAKRNKKKKKNKKI